MNSTTSSTGSRPTARFEILKASRKKATLRFDVEFSELTRLWETARLINPRGTCGTCGCWCTVAVGVVCVSVRGVSFLTSNPVRSAPFSKSVSSNFGPSRDGAGEASFSLSFISFSVPLKLSLTAAAFFFRRFALVFGFVNSNAARSIAAKCPVGVELFERFERRCEPREPPASGVAVLTPG
jgi:hypothetical protein